MRNLACWQSVPHSFSQQDGRRICSTAFDIDEDALLILAEKTNNSGNVDLEIWSLPNREYGVSVMKQGVKITFIGRFLQASTIIAMYAPSPASSNPWSAETSRAGANQELVHMKLLPDSRTIVLITRTGDLLTFPLEDMDPQV